MEFFKNEHLLLGILCVLLIMPTQSLALGDAHAKIVYNVSGLQDYQLHWNDRFPPGSTLMIYAEADDINHRRAVGVDYVLIIRDSNNNIVDTSVYNSRHSDYRSDDFIKYSKNIDESFDDGTYVAEIHIFDLLNDSLMDDYYNLVEKTLVNNKDYDTNFSHHNYYNNNNNCYYDNRFNYNYNNNNNNHNCNATVPDIPYMDRSFIIDNIGSMGNQYKKIVQTFFVDKYANKYPANRFMLENISLDMYNIAPGAPIHINTSVTNNFYDSGIVSMDLLLDDKVVNNATIEIGPYSSKTITITVPAEITGTMSLGNHTLGIVPTSYNTIGPDLNTTFKIAGIPITISATFNYNDIQTSKLAVKPNETLMVTVSVENKGGAGSHSVGILINNIPVEEKIVYVNSLENKDVSFNITEKELGEYKVSINNTNLSKIFFVESNETVVQPTKTQVAEKQIPKVFIVAGLSILLILIYIIRKKFVSRGIVGTKTSKKKEK